MGCLWSCRHRIISFVIGLLLLEFSVGKGCSLFLKMLAGGLNLGISAKIFTQVGASKQGGC